MAAFIMVIIVLTIAGVRITKEQYEADSMMCEMIGKTKAERKAIARKYGIR